MKRRVMIVEDDEIFLRPLRRTLEVAGFEVLAAPSGEEAIDVLKGEDVDLVLTDRRLPGMDGGELVRRIKADHPDLAVVMMTAYGTIESAVEAMRLGAANYLVKPFDTAEMLIVLRHAIEFHELRAASRATLRRNQERFTLKNVLAQSAAMREVFEVLRSVADLDTTLLIHGETGVGKELLARSVHFSGARREKPFVAVNCAAIPAELFESELFGFRKGAFTGAAETRRGLLQSASGGTLLLDEIGEMPLGLQSKLLRVIEDKRVTSIGSDRAVEIDVRFIATTNKDLRAEVERGAFRPDLFYRLSVMPIRVPPLRERDGDVPLLARHFLDESARRSKKPVRRHRARRHAGPLSLPLARQHSRTGERHRAGGDRGAGRHHRGRRAFPRPRERAPGGGPLAALPRREGPRGGGVRARLHQRACWRPAGAS